MGIAVDENGDLYIGDSANNVIRHVTFQPALLTFPTEPVGAVSPAETVSPFNLGNEPLTLSSVGSSSSFLQTASGFTDCAIASVLAPGSTCNVAIEFTVFDHQLPELNGERRNRPIRNRVDHSGTCPLVQRLSLNV
jgi:hypothetical protein